MSENNGREWYTNKELFIQINQLSKSLTETNANIKKYNGLREKIDDVENRQKSTDDSINVIEKKVNNMETMISARRGFGQSVRDWGGWIFALLMLILSALQYI